MLKNTLILFSLLLPGQPSIAQITATDFNIVVRAFHAEYDQELKTKNQLIVVNPATNPQSVGLWWNLDDIHAAYSSLYDSDTKILTHYLFLLGGYARLKGMTRDGVAATLCHELGHGIAGEPYKYNEYEKTDVSVEGQADYFAFRYCLPRIFKRLPATNPVKPVSAYTDSLCRTIPATSYEFCTRAFETLETERTFFKLNPKDPNTTYDKPDSSVVDSIETDPYYYPSSQCRIDTMMNGLLGKERPRCWYKPPGPAIVKNN